MGLKILLYFYVTPWIYFESYIRYNDFLKSVQMFLLNNI